MSLRKLFVFILFPLVLSSCGGSDDGEEPEENTFEFSVTEVYDISSPLTFPQLIFTLKTLEDQPCSNHTLISTDEFSSGVLKVTVTGLSEEQICLSPPGPATKRIYITENLNEIIIEQNGRQDRFDVRLSEESVEISPIDASFSSQEFGTYFRYPRNSFECICGTVRSEALLCEEFRDELLQEFPTLQQFEFGAGKIPYSVSSEGHDADTPTTYYTYANEAQFDAVGEFMSTFAEERIPQNLASRITITLTNWLNKSFRSN